MRDDAQCCTSKLISDSQGILKPLIMGGDIPTKVARQKQKSHGDVSCPENTHNSEGGCLTVPPQLQQCGGTEHQSQRQKYKRHPASPCLPAYESPSEKNRECESDGMLYEPIRTDPHQIPNENREFDAGKDREHEQRCATTSHHREGLLNCVTDHDGCLTDRA